jgi:DNA-binding transcriptional regulator GbsR (MarR family)
MTRTDNTPLEFTNLTAIERTKLEKAGIETVGQLLAVFETSMCLNNIKPIAGVSIKNIASALKPYKKSL